VVDDVLIVQRQSTPQLALLAAPSRIAFLLATATAGSPSEPTGCSGLEFLVASLSFTHSLSAPNSRRHSRYYILDEDEPLYAPLLLLLKSFTPSVTLEASRMHSGFRRPSFLRQRQAPRRVSMESSRPPWSGHLPSHRRLSAKRRTGTNTDTDTLRLLLPAVCPPSPTHVLRVDPAICHCHACRAFAIAVQILTGVSIPFASLVLILIRI
jgi:hypothetical protein